MPDLTSSLQMQWSYTELHLDQTQFFQVDFMVYITQLYPNAHFDKIPV